MLLWLFWCTPFVRETHEIRNTRSREICTNNLFDAILSPKCIAAYPFFSRQYVMHEQNPFDETKACFVQFQQAEELCSSCCARTHIHTHTRNVSFGLFYGSPCGYIFLWFRLSRELSCVVLCAWLSCLLLMHWIVVSLVLQRGPIKYAGQRKGIPTFSRLSKVIFKIKLKLNVRCIMWYALKRWC